MLRAFLTGISLTTYDNKSQITYFSNTASIFTSRIFSVYQQRESLSKA